MLKNYTALIREITEKKGIKTSIVTSSSVNAESEKEARAIFQDMIYTTIESGLDWSFYGEIICVIDTEFLFFALASDVRTPSEIHDDYIRFGKGFLNS